MSDAPASSSKETVRLPCAERLLAVTRTLSQGLEPNELLQTLIRSACELTDSQASFLLLYEEETGLLKFIAAPPGSPEAIKRIRIPLEQSAVGQCFLQARPFRIQNADQEQRIYREIDEAVGFRTASLLAVPLLYRQKTLGVMEAINKKHNAHYTEEDLTILETLATLAGVVLQNAFLAEQTQRTQRQLEDLDRMKSDFVAIASHELRTPLGLILGHATYLKENFTDSEAQTHLEVVVSSATRLKKILEDLSNVDMQSSRIRIQQQRFALDQLIIEVMSAYQQQADEKRVTLINDLPNAPLLVEGDPEKIVIAIDNLVKNALQFTNSGGHILVSAESLPGYAKVSVVDDGIGIPAKDLQRVFEKFYQVASHMTRRHGGLGLGLSVAKVMVEMHGGQIWIESLEGKGSNVSFLLPNGTPLPAAQSAAPPKPHKKVSAFEGM